MPAGKRELPRERARGAGPGICETRRTWSDRLCDVQAAATRRQAELPRLGVAGSRRGADRPAHEQRRSVANVRMGRDASAEAVHPRGHRAGQLPGAGAVSTVDAVGGQGRKRDPLSLHLLQLISRHGRVSRSRDRRRGSDARVPDRGGVRPDVDGRRDLRARVDRVRQQRGPLLDQLPRHSSDRLSRRIDRSSARTCLRTCTARVSARAAFR